MPRWAHDAIAVEMASRNEPRLYRSPYVWKSTNAAKRSIAQMNDADIEDLLVRQRDGEFPADVNLSHLYHRLPTDAAYRTRAFVPEYRRRLEEAPSWNLIPRDFSSRSVNHIREAVEKLLDRGILPPPSFPVWALPRQHPVLHEGKKRFLASLTPEQRRQLHASFSERIYSGPPKNRSALVPDRVYGPEAVLGHRKAVNTLIKKRKRATNNNGGRNINNISSNNNN